MRKRRMKTKKSRALLIFVKNPVLGKVKTRLAADIGQDKALRVYQQLLEITREVVQQVDAQRYVFYSDQVEDDGWSEAFFQKRKQVGDDLGARMKNAFQEVLETHDAAVIVGSDCPDISVSLIDAAFTHLETHDAVLGPSQDGGYYLLGLKNLAVDVFSDMPWSTAEVLGKTIQVLVHEGQTIYALPALNDIDNLADLDASDLLID